MYYDIYYEIFHQRLLNHVKEDHDIIYESYAKILQIYNMKYM